MNASRGSKIQGLILETKRVDIISWLLESGHGASGFAGRDGPWPDVRMAHVIDFWNEERRTTVSNADLEPPMTRTDFMSGEERRVVFAARLRVWIIGGVKSLVGNLGVFGVDVRPVAMMSFLQVNFFPVEVSTLHKFFSFVMFETGESKITRSLMVLPAKTLCIENASRYDVT